MNTLDRPPGASGPDPAPPTDNGSMPGAKARILIADDRPTEREYLRTVLGYAGYQVIEADDGEAAWALLSSLHPDLLISDILMPKLDGLELVRRMRSQPDTAGTRVIIWSASFRQQEAENMTAALGVARFVKKPVEPGILLATVADILKAPAPAPVPEAVLARLDEAHQRLLGDTLYKKALELEEEIRARQRTEEALRDSERRLALALEAGGSAVWDMEVASGSVRGTDLLYSMLGYAKGDLATLADWIGLIHPEDRGGIPELVRDIIQGRRDKYEFEARLQARDGSWRWVLSQALATERDERGQAVRLVGTHTDVTRRKTAETEIQRLNTELEERVRQRTAELEHANQALLRSNMELQHFAHATAHDLQTPLRAIAGFARLLQQEVEGRGDEQVEQWSSLVIANTKRLQTLIQEVLAYTRLDSDGRPFEPVDLGKLFGQVLASLAPLIQETGAQVSRCELPTLSMDRTQMAQVLQNLVENGIKYNRSRPPKVSLACDFQENEWVFAVGDNGIGIDPRHHERIFEIFRRLHSYSQVPGTGIGLALCRRIVERHGGRIWVESRPGEGSTFYFTLPVEKTEDQGPRPPLPLSGR